jgi:hypothetical protein
MCLTTTKREKRLAQAINFYHSHNGSVTARSKYWVNRFVDCTIEDTRLRREESFWEEGRCPFYTQYLLTPVATPARRRRGAPAIVG